MTGGSGSRPDQPGEWPRIRSILHEALELPPGMRPAFLDRACAGEPVVRAEVESLLQAADQTAFLDRPPVAAPGLAIGGMLGPYRILEKLGQGGMGAVYKANDTRLDRVVALKVISAPGSRVNERRFAREARAVSALNHPNIITLYEFDSENGMDFLAMEYVRGVTLDKMQDRPLEERLGFARQAAAGIARAHESGIVHRDLKPGNIMVTDEGRVKVLDFGLAKRDHSSGALEADATLSLDLTMAGTSVGTPSYMSPEQLSGEEEDWRSDIFSFGVILFELTCGCKPFRGKTLHATLSQVAHDPAPDPASLNPAIPRELAQLILQCMEKDRTRRIQSMTEVAARLDAIGTARPAPRSSRRAWVAGVGAAVCATIVGALLWLTPARPGLDLSIEAQKMRDGQPAGDPYIASASDAFEGGQRFRLQLQSRRSGYLYVVNEGPGDAGSARFWILYAHRVAAKQRELTGWWVFDSNPGAEKLWIVWSPNPLKVFDEALALSPSGRVQSPDNASAIERALKSAAQEGTAEGTLGRVLKLNHR